MRRTRRESSRQRRHTAIPCLTREVPVNGQEDSVSLCDPRYLLLPLSELMRPRLFLKDRLLERTSLPGRVFRHHGVKYLIPKLSEDASVSLDRSPTATLRLVLSPCPIPLRMIDARPRTLAPPCTAQFVEIPRVIESAMEAHKADLSAMPSIEDIVEVSSSPSLVARNVGRCVSAQHSCFCAPCPGMHHAGFWPLVRSYEYPSGASRLEASPRSLVVRLLVVRHFVVAP